MMDPEELLAKTDLAVDLSAVHEDRKSFLMALQTIQIVQVAVKPYAVTGRKAWLVLQKAAMLALSATKPVVKISERSSRYHGSSHEH